MAYDFGLLYRRVRSGKGFLIGLCVFCAAWGAWNLIPGLPHFDDSSFGLLTSILSVEASIGLSVYQALAEAWRRTDDRWQRDADHQHAEAAELLRYVHDMLQAQSVTMQAVHDHILARSVDAAACAGMAAVDGGRGHE